MAGIILQGYGAAAIVPGSTVAIGGNIAIVQGTDYKAADGSSFDFLDSGNVWPDLTSATVTIALLGGLMPYSRAGSVVVASGSGKTVRWEPSASDTAAIAVGLYRLSVTATLASGHVRELVSALANVTTA